MWKIPFASRGVLLGIRRHSDREDGLIDASCLHVGRTGVLWRAGTLWRAGMLWRAGRIVPVIALMAGWIFAAVFFAADSVAKNRPNVLFILADDLSWSDLACYGHPYHETPNLDRLASEGMRFTDAYAPAPICSATRAAILTGKTPARLHFEFVTKNRDGSQDLEQPLQSPPYPTNLPLREETVGEVLSAAGYRTGFYGKWHVNQHHERYLGWSPTHGPPRQGFGQGDPDFGSHPYAYFRGGNRDKLDLGDGEYPPDSLTDKVIGFLQDDRSQPFFLYWSHYYVHDPVHTRCGWLFERYRERLPAEIPDSRVTYATMVATLDHQVGRVLEVLRAEGIADETVVVFLSDNGGHPNFAANGPHRGSKWNLYEGGIRVPMIVRWPGRIEAGAVCSEPVHGCDLLPTFEEIAATGADAVATESEPIERDGISLLPLIDSAEAELPSRSLVWHFPYYHPERGFAKAPAKIGVNDFVTSQTRPHSAIRWGRYKLLHFDEDGRDELYDLVADRDESDNLAARRPALTRRLREELRSELQACGARFAEPAESSGERDDDASGSESE